MAQTDNPFLDGMAKVFTDAAGMAQGVRTEIDTFMKQRLERLMADMDFVPREEFEAVKAMAAKARAENEALAARLQSLKTGLWNPNQALRPRTDSQLRICGRKPAPAAQPKINLKLWNLLQRRGWGVSDSCAATKSCASLDRNCFVLCSGVPGLCQGSNDCHPSG